jgi:hypothetical protein
VARGICGRSRTTAVVWRGGWLLTLQAGVDLMRVSGLCGLLNAASGWLSGCGGGLGISQNSPCCCSHDWNLSVAKGFKSVQSKGHIIFPVRSDGR